MTLVSSIELTGNILGAFSAFVMMIAGGLSLLDTKRRKARAPDLLIVSLGFGGGAIVGLSIFLLVSVGFWIAVEYGIAVGLALTAVYGCLRLLSAWIDAKERSWAARHNIHVNQLKLRLALGFFMFGSGLLFVQQLLGFLK